MLLPVPPAVTAHPGQLSSPNILVRKLGHRNSDRQPHAAPQVQALGLLVKERGTFGKSGAFLELTSPNCSAHKQLTSEQTTLPSQAVLLLTRGTLLCSCPWPERGHGIACVLHKAFTKHQVQLAMSQTAEAVSTRE